MNKAAMASGGYSQIPEAEPPAYTARDAELLFPPPPPPSKGKRRLDLPVCLPQTVGGFDSPFARAYNPVLAASDVEQDDWLRFLDALNIAMAASPPLRVIDLAGLVIGFVPYHWAMIAGILIQTAAQTGMHVIQKTLTDRLLRRANETYFEPRGLKVRLMKTAAMRVFCGIDAKGSTPSKTKQFATRFGHATESVVYRLPIPFVGRIVGALSGPSNVDPNTTENVTERRLDALKGYIMPVSFDVPPSIPPASVMDKASDLSVKLRMWRGKKSESSAMRNRRLLAIAEGRAQPGQYESSADGSWWQAKKERRARRRGKKRTRKLRGRVAKADRLESNTTSDLVWVVLMNADQDREVEGTELADNLNDEQIDDDEWDEEIELEEEEDEEAAMEAHKEGHIPSSLRPGY